MNATKLYLSGETKDALRDLAEARGTSQSALIRENMDRDVWGRTENRDQEAEE